MGDLNIPEDFKNDLIFRECSDKRTNAEIIGALSKYQPVTTEKNVWAFWDKGITSMPSWSKRNVVDWVRILGTSWTVRVLDSVPGSPNHALNHVPAKLLPDTFVNGTMNGPWKGPHAADLLRGACLYEHGGVFMDVGNILIRHLDRICWNQLEDPNSPFQVATPWMYGIIMANHFVASRKGDPFIKRWHDLFVHLWKDRTNYDGLIQNPLVAFAQELSFDDTRRSNYHWDYKVDAKTVFEYITQVVCWMRVCMLENDDGFSGMDYWMNNVLIWDALPENWGVEATLGFNRVGEKALKLLSTKRDADPDSEDYKEAYNLVWRLLTQSSMQKIVHGSNITNDKQLGKLLDENPCKDAEPGTFGELYRYGTVHFEQTRPEICYAKAPRPDKTLKKGLLEP